MIQRSGLVAGVVLALLASGAKADPAARYDACLTQIEIDPRAALSAAEAWDAGGGGAPARHCAGLALVALERYDEGGRLLLALGHDPGIADAVMRADLLGQAGNAYLLAGKGGSAREAFSLALQIMPGEPNLLLDRARAHAMEKAWGAAVADLDAVIAAAPTAAGAYVLRAAARRHQGDLRGARNDIDIALLRDPSSLDALLERGYLRAAGGDMAGARADFEAVIAEGPGTTTAAAAELALADLP